MWKRITKAQDKRPDLIRGATEPKLDAHVRQRLLDLEWRKASLQSFN